MSVALQPSFCQPTPPKQGSGHLVSALSTAPQEARGTQEKWAAAAPAGGKSEEHRSASRKWHFARRFSASPTKTRSASQSALSLPFTQPRSHDQSTPFLDRQSIANQVLRFPSAFDAWKQLVLRLSWVRPDRRLFAVFLSPSVSRSLASSFLRLPSTAHLLTTTFPSLFRTR